MNTNAKVVYEFGPFHMDPDKQVLLRDGQLIAVSPKAFEMLLVLVRRGREVVSKEELLKQIWPDSFVEEANLSQQIFRLRKALGDTVEGERYIVTLPGRGYRFAVPVRTITEGGDVLIAQTRSRAQIVIEEHAPEPVETQPALPPSAHAKPKWWKWLLPAGAAAAIAALGLLLLPRHHQTIPLTETDTVVLADFANSTGDPAFDGTLRQGLAIQLEQSPFLSLISEDRIKQEMAMMGRPGDARLTGEIAREVCQRTGSTAVIDGSIASLGSQYVLGLKAVNCHTGDSLAEEQATVESKERVLKALSDAAAKLRAKLGETLSTVQKFDTPLEQATTPSFEALRAYSLGEMAKAGDDPAAAVPFFERAIRLDSNFAMAYAKLGTSYRSLIESSLGTENLQKAYDLRDRVSDQEKFYIESYYFEVVTGDLEKARQVDELWAQIYSRDWTPRIGLWVIYTDLGQYDKALGVVRESIRLHPNANGYCNLVLSYLILNRLQEARSAAEEAQAKQLDSPALHFILYRLAFLQNDAAGMAREVAWVAGKPRVEDNLLAREAETAAYSGQLEKARELSRRAVASAVRAEENEVAAMYEDSAALREALFGNAVEGRQRAAAALVVSNGLNAQQGAALALAVAGDAKRAQVLADDLATRFPANTLVRFNFIPTIAAQVELIRNDPLKAVETLEAAAPYELGSPFGVGLYPVYVRGQAYLAAHRGIEASAEFEKIIEHRGVVVNRPTGALAHLGLARAYAMQGETAKAKAAYQDFLTLWKDADSGIPILKQAKMEYARLQ
jgi:DNA-binding winged helix-turn-helix (wHTH) protein/tetratricopeptide (TPR) repeat protein